MAVPTRSSEQIREDIVRHLQWDSRVDASQITVRVSGSDVILEGTVLSSLARKAAEMDAWTTVGVRFVDNRLTVRVDGARRPPSDAEIGENVERNLRANPNLDISGLQVSLVNGVVTIEGSVESYWAKILAEELAGDVTGVVGVTNKVSVVPTHDIVDDAIADAVVSSLDRRPAVNVDSIDVQVENGVVTLSGHVPSWMGLQDALNAARHTVGVTNVVNHLIIE